MKDSISGEEQIGTTIQLVGTYHGSNSDAEGKYKIADIKPGVYTVRVSMIGYAERQYTGITIRSGEATRLNVVLIPADLTTEVVVITGQTNLVNLESGMSQSIVDQSQIRNMAVNDVQQIVALQVGVSQTPNGLQIRGGRVYETQYLVDGVSAQDALAGTGFGVDVGAGAISQLEVITGGVGAEFSGGTAGVVSTRIREGGTHYFMEGRYERDNFGVNKNQGFSWNTDNLSLSMGGPLIPTGKLREKFGFFVSGSMRLTDEFFNVTANQLRTSLFDEPERSEFWAPRQDNRWNATLKLTYNILPGTKISISSQSSLNINQNTNALQIVGNNEVMQPGLQFGFMQNLDNAATFAHRTNLTVVNFSHLFGKDDRWRMEITLGRLFTNLRADANGRPFRDINPGQVYDPSSIITNYDGQPITVFNPGDSIVFVNPSSGFVNNGGIATLWHDHYSQEYTGKIKFTYRPTNKVHVLSGGWEHKEFEYLWVDVTRPWVGAPIVVNDSVTFSANRIGSSNDIWKSRPAEGGIFFQDNIRYKGIVATIGFRFSYWAMGRFADDAVNNPEAPVLETVRRSYLDETVELGRRFKGRILPKLNVSFPVTNNNVLYFNYSHSLRMPHPRFVYAGLDPVFQNNSFLPNLGNPNINPETSVSYELGLKTQFNQNNALTVTAFYNNRFDYIVSRRVQVRDISGRFVDKRFFINQDYARIRGLEVAYFKRIGAWFEGQLSVAYQVATGKSNSAFESSLQIAQQGFVNTTTEQFLAWDRPLDIKFMTIFKTDTTFGIFRDIRIFFTATYKSGFRYTPAVFQGNDEVTGRPLYDLDNARPMQSLGSSWFWADLRITRDFRFGKRRNQYVGVFIAIMNILDNKNAAIYNSVTGRAWEPGDAVTLGFRDPRYPSPVDFGARPDNPARYLQPRQLMFGTSFSF